MKKIFLFLFLSQVSSLLFAQLTYIRGYSNILGKNIQVTSDDGYVLSGSGTGFNGHSDFHLIKTNGFGDTLWTRIYGTSGNDIAEYCEQTFDEGYIIGGTTDPSNSSGNQKMFVVKTNSFGDTLWTKTYDGIGDDFGIIRQSRDSGYIIADDNDGGLTLIKTDSTGNIIWTNNFETTAMAGWITLRGITESPDGGIMIVGSYHENFPQNTGIILIKTDTLGNLLWDKKYGAFPFNEGYDIQVTDEGGYVVGGAISDLYLTFKNLCILKVDSMGDIDWYKSYGGDSSIMEWGFSIRQTYDGGFFISGISTGVGNGVGAFVVKTDRQGDTLWTKGYGSSNTGSNVYGVQTPDEGFIIMADINVMGPYPTFLIKTDKEGVSGCYDQQPKVTVRNWPVTPTSPVLLTTPNVITVGHTATGVSYVNNNIYTVCMQVSAEEINTKEYVVNIFPNPFQNSITVSTSLNGSFTIHIYDMTGRKLLSQIFSSSVELPTEKLVSGIYIYEIRNGDEILEMGKLVKN